MRKRDERFRYIGMGGTLKLPAFFQRQVQQRIGCRELALAQVNVTEGLIEFGLHFGLFVEGARLLHAAIEQGDDAQAVGGTCGGIASLKEVEHELLNALGAGGLCEGSVAGIRQAPGKEDHQRDYGQQHHRDSNDWRAAARDELACPVSPGIGTSLKWLVIQVVIEIADERLDRRIAPVGLFCAWRRGTTHPDRPTPSRWR